MSESTCTPYSSIKENERNYKIMLLLDEGTHTSTDVGGMLGMSPPQVQNIYRQMKRKEVRLYCDFLASHANGDANYYAIRLAAYNCYVDSKCVAAYFEKEYADILAEYRAGEPGMAQEIIDSLPPLREQFSKRTIARVVEMREAEHKTFAAIGKRLRMTDKKAQDLYQHYYHEKGMSLMEIIERKTGENVQMKYFLAVRSAKRRYEMLMQDYPALFGEQGS